jgi:hypothetical protein
MPPQFSFLGTDVDFVKNGVLSEVQFSNYPFLLNNTVRSELLYKAKTLLVGQAISVVVIITKTGKIRASNSTLYYEQAQNQLNALATNHVFDVPIRLVGLFAQTGTGNAVFTQYPARYSRTSTSQSSVRVTITTGRSAKSRHTIVVIEDDFQIADGNDQVVPDASKIPENDEATE